MSQVIVEKHGIITTQGLRETRCRYGGITDKVMATVNGDKVMIKGDHARESLAEYFAYKLGEYLGLNINKVKLIDCGDLLGLSKICSVHWWEDDFEEQDGYRRELTGEEENKLGFFDAIINNEDRHNSNYGYVNNELFLIDHGMSEPWCELDKFQHFYEIKKALKCPYCQEIVDKFLELTADELYEMLELPIEISSQYDPEIFDKIVARMLDVQDYILELRIN